MQTNVVNIGSKPLTAYLLAATTIAAKGAKQVIIRARGRKISMAVDVSEILRRQYYSNATISNILTATEIITDSETKKPINVSVIEITILLGGAQ